MDNVTEVLSYLVSVSFTDLGIEGLNSDIPAFTAVIAVVMLWVLFKSLKRSLTRFIKLAFIKTFFFS